MTKHQSPSKQPRATPWTAEDLATLRQHYPDLPTAEVAALLGRRVGQLHQAAAVRGIKKNAAFFASDAAGRITRGRSHPAMVANQYKTGHLTWNTGKKGWSAPGTEATRFKLGGAPVNRREVGALRINSSGQLDIKMAEGIRQWYQLSHYIWFLERGEWPGHGMCLRFKDGDEQNPAYENLQLITRQENMRLNSVHTLYPPEIARLVQLRGALNRRINSDTCMSATTTPASTSNQP